MTTLSRGSYTHWACYKCRQLHRIFETDLPGCPFGTAWRREKCSLVGPRDQPSGFRATALTPREDSGLKFHHVQIALRFARLLDMQHVHDDDDNDRGQASLRAVPECLLVEGQAPTISAMDIRDRIMHPPSMTTTHYNPKLACRCVIKQDFERRIIQDHMDLCPITNLPQLRFLQKTEVDIVRHKAEGYPRADIIYKICPHLGISVKDTSSSPLVMTRWHWSLGSPWAPRRMRSVASLLGYALETATTEQFSSMVSHHWKEITREIYQHCNRCLTDYYIAYSDEQPEKLSLCIWQDFGTECSYYDAGDWDNHESYYRTRTTYPAIYFPHWQPSWSEWDHTIQSHKPGYVYRLYIAGEQVPPRPALDIEAPSTPATPVHPLPELWEQAASSCSDSNVQYFVMRRPSVVIGSASRPRTRQYTQDLLRRHILEIGVEAMPISSIISYVMSLCEDLVHKLINKLWRD